MTTQEEGGLALEGRRQVVLPPLFVLRRNGCLGVVPPATQPSPLSTLQALLSVGMCQGRSIPVSARRGPRRREAENDPVDGRVSKRAGWRLVPALGIDSDLALGADMSSFVLHKFLVVHGI